MKKTILIYYSFSNGNTERVANYIASRAEIDVFKVETVKEYGEDVNDVGAAEVKEKFEPELKEIPDLSEYEVVIIGTPTWWYSISPAIRSLLSKVDLTGKTVVPFTTNGGWPGQAMRTLRKLCAKAKEIVEPKAVRFDSSGGAVMKTPPIEVVNWAKRVVKNVINAS